MTVISPKNGQIVVYPRTEKTLVAVGGSAPVSVTAPTGKQGPPGTVNVVELSQDDYDALGVKDPMTIYVITDGTVLVGPPGPPGPPGSTILIGSGPPTTVGNAGDYYLDTAGDVLYGPKSATGQTWPVALVGVPPGGNTGQRLTKLSGSNYDVGWS